MDELLTSLSFWHRLLVTYTIVMGVEAPFLLFVASLRRRPWYEQALALLPAGGFGLGLYLARSARVALAAWQSHVSFQQTHYSPDYWPAFAREQRTDLQALAANTQQQAIAMGALTLALLMGGWVLLLHWLTNPRPMARPASVDATAEPPTDEDLVVDEEQGSLEITIEPIEREKR
jgi:hypothetical protein